MIGAVLGATAVATLGTLESQAKLVEAFGERPLGLPVLWLATAVLAALVTPIAMAGPSMVRVIGQIARDGGRSSLSELIRFRERHPEMRREWNHVVGVLIYFWTLAITWIVYATLRGI